MTSQDQRAREADRRRYKKISSLINTMTAEQARFALHLINHDTKGFLGMPERQQKLSANIRRAIRARN